MTVAIPFEIDDGGLSATRDAVESSLPASRAAVDDAAAVSSGRLPSSTYLDGVVAALREYESRLRHFSEGVSALPADMLSRVSTRDDSWIWLREALLPPRLGPVPPLAFVNAGERLGVAEPVLLRRALAVRALYARRSAVRRCIDRALLDQMRAAVGAQTLDALRRVAATDGETTLPLPEMLDAASLAQEGLWRLRRESAIAIPAIVSLVAMQLDGAAAPDGYPCEPGGSGERARFFARLPLLIPELP